MASQRYRPVPVGRKAYLHWLIGAVCNTPAGIARAIAIAKDGTTDARLVAAMSVMAKLKVDPSTSERMSQDAGPMVVMGGPFAGTRRARASALTVNPASVEVQPGEREGGIRGTGDACQGGSQCGALVVCLDNPRGPACGVFGG